MFSCFKASRGSGSKKANSSRLGRLWRCLMYPLICCWQSSPRDPEDCPQHKQEPGSQPKTPMSTNEKSVWLDKILYYIPRGIWHNDHTSVMTFFQIYRNYVTTWEVIDHMMRMYGAFCPDSEWDKRIKSSLFTFLLYWLQKFPEDFRESPDVNIVKHLRVYVRLIWEDGDPHGSVLLSVLEDVEAKTLQLGNDSKPTPEAQVQEAQVSGMQESLVLGPDSVEEPQGGLLPGEDSELLEMTPVEPFVPEDDPVQLPTLDQALPPSAATPSPVAASADVSSGVEADEVADVTARVPSVQYIVFSTVVHLGAPECYFPLPEVDI